MIRALSRNVRALANFDAKALAVDVSFETTGAALFELGW